MSPPRGKPRAGDFETPGMFWVPGGSRVPGIFAISGSDCELRLLGSFSPNEVFGRTAKYPIIWGDLHSPAPGGGTNVTLLDSFTSHVSWSGGSMLETVVANRAFVGSEHLPDGRTSFVEVRATIQGLSSLTRGPAVLVHGPQESGALPKIDIPPSTLRSVNVAGASIEFHADSNMKFMRAGRKVSVARRASVIVKPPQPLAEDEFSRSYLVPLSNLMSLVRGKTATIRSISYVLRDEQPWPPDVRDLRLNARRSTKRKAVRLPDELLFELPRDDAALEDLLTKWLALWARHRRVLGLVFGLMEAPPTFTDTRFELTLQALDLVARRCAGLESFEDLVRAMPDATEKLVGDAETFIDDLKRTRAVLWEQEAPFGFRLYWLTEAVMWLLKLRLAMEAGISLAQMTVRGGFTRGADLVRTRLASND